MEKWLKVLEEESIKIEPWEPYANEILRAKKGITVVIPFLYRRTVFIVKLC